MAIFGEMDARIRTIRNSEIPLLDDFLYEAIWQPDPQNPLPREVIRMPALRAYVEAFGTRGTDLLPGGRGRRTGCRCRVEPLPARIRMGRRGDSGTGRRSSSAVPRARYRNAALAGDARRTARTGLCRRVTLRTAGQSRRRTLSAARVPRGRSRGRGVCDALRLAVGTGPFQFLFGFGCYLCLRSRVGRWIPALRKMEFAI